MVSLLYLTCVSLNPNMCSQPIHFAWDQVRPGAKGRCFREDDFFIGSGSVNAGLNFLLFVLVGHHCSGSFRRPWTYNGMTADTTSTASSHHRQATNRSDRCIYIGGLVSPSEGLRLLLIANFAIV